MMGGLADANSGSELCWWWGVFLSLTFDQYFFSEMSRSDKFMANMRQTEESPL